MGFAIARADPERQPRETSGKVQQTGGEMRAEIVSPSGPTQFILPPPTLMPVAAIDHLIERLQARAASFPALTFDAEVIGDAFLVDVTELNPGEIRAARPGDKPIAMPTTKSWPVFMTFTRGRQQDQQPLFTVKALVFDNGVLDRLTVETGLVTVTADLQTLEMHKSPVCPAPSEAIHPPVLSERISDMSASLVWFRNDLRLADNPALIAGLGSGRPVIPVFILDEETPGIRPMGAASRWWLHHSLQSLDASLRAAGFAIDPAAWPGRARDRRGRRRVHGATAVYWNRAYDLGAPANATSA